jgi:hypothetical protein
LSKQKSLGFTLNKKLTPPSDWTERKVSYHSKLLKVFPLIFLIKKDHELEIETICEK